MLSRTDFSRRTPQLPDVAIVTGTGLSSSAFHIDAKRGHFGADHRVEGHPTEQGQGAALDLSAARRTPELFISGECLAEGRRRTLQTMLHKAVHALAQPGGVKDTPGAASTTARASLSPSLANSAWPGRKASGPIR